MEEKKKSSLSKSKKTDTPKKAEKLDENKEKSDTKPKRRVNKITPARIKKEIDFLKPMFDGCSYYLPSFFVFQQHGEYIYLPSTYFWICCISSGGRIEVLFS